VGDALDAADVVVVTGGLGPTPDDLTREAVAELFGATLQTDSRLLTRLKERFQARGYESLPVGAEGMAQVPEGGTILPNPHGAAPGLGFETPDGKLCLLLPGIPGEMKGIFLQEAEPLLASRFRGRLGAAVHRVIHTAGIPESVLMSDLDTVLPSDSHGVSLAYLPDSLGVKLRLTARELPGMEAASDRLRTLETLMEPVISKYRYEAESGDLAEAVGDALMAGGDHLAVAESCTGGLIAKRMTDIPGSSGYFRGGVVAYANEIKTSVLGIDRGILDEAGVVSELVAGALAEGVARKLNASVGIGVTGVAGPGGGSEEKPVGTVCYAVALRGRTLTRKEVFLGDRSAIRERSAHATLGFLLRVLDGRDG
jgi:nicotinamide-nucleotide amidase